MDKTPIRRFSLTFDEVITKAQSVQPQFEADLGQFSGFDPWFTVAVNDGLLANITAGITDSSESTHTAQIERTTETISQLLSTAGRSYQKLMYYVENSLGNTKAINDTFGRSRYDKARQSEKEMVSLLTQVGKAIVANSYTAKLVAAGMPVSLPDELEELATDLAKADGQQEMLKKQQLLVTSERIELFNAIWDTLSKISSASKVLYSEDLARLAIYQLYDSSTVEKEKPEATA